jgi:hypothetical protein
MNNFNDFDKTKIDKFKNKISTSIQKYITRLSELVNQNNILLKYQKETEAKIILNEDEKKKLLIELEIKNKELDNYKKDSFDQIDKNNKTIDTLNKNITEINNNTQILINEKKLLEEKLIQITNEKKNLEKELENLKTDNNLKIIQIEELQNKIKVFEEKSKLDDNTKNEFEDLKKKLEEKNKILEEREKIINLCNDKTKLFEQQIDRLKNITDIQTYKMSDLDDKYDIDIPIIQKVQKLQIQRNTQVSEAPNTPDTIFEAVETQLKVQSDVNETDESLDNQIENILKNIENNINNINVDNIQFKRINTYIKKDSDGRKTLGGNILNGIGYIPRQFNAISPNNFNIILKDHDDLKQNLKKLVNIILKLTKEECNNNNKDYCNIKDDTQKLEENLK